jgi:hypothetical protein
VVKGVGRVKIRSEHQGVVSCECERCVRRESLSECTQCGRVGRARNVKGSDKMARLQPSALASARHEIHTIHNRRWLNGEPCRWRGGEEERVG